MITTGELELLMSEKGWDLSVPVEGETSPTTATITPLGTTLEPTLPELVQHPGTSSGSYLHTIMSAMVRASPEPLETSVKTIRSADYEEYLLRSQRTGEVVFKGAKCYGFRNLQNLVRKVGKEAGVQVGRGAAGRAAAVRVRSRKTGTGVGGEDKGYDYVEVMACPGGCINGGGQLRPIAQVSQQTEDEEGYPRNWDESGVKMADGESGSATPGAKWGNKEWTKEVEKAYWHDLPTPPQSPKREGDPLGDALDRLVVQVKVETCLPQDPLGQSGWSSEMDVDAEQRRRELFRTQYRAIESEVIGLAVKW